MYYHVTVRFVCKGELLRKKRREKDGHKDPVLIDLSRLQEDTMVQISKLRSEQRESDKKHEELVKVALILGIDYKESKNSGDHKQPTSWSRKESTRSPEKPVASTSHNKVKVELVMRSQERYKVKCIWQDYIAILKIILIGMSFLIVILIFLKTH